MSLVGFVDFFSNSILKTKVFFTGKQLIQKIADLDFQEA